MSGTARSGSPPDSRWLRSSWTNKLIRAKDHSSVQINIGHLDEEGVYNKQFTTFALSGKVRGSVRGPLLAVYAWGLL